MKKSILITTVFLVLGTHSIMSQENTKTKIPKHELSIDMYNLLNPIKFSGISFSYDRLLNESESLGLTATYDFNDFALGMNYKHFFSKKYAQGFYTEVGMTYKTGQYYTAMYKHHYNSLDRRVIDYNAVDVDLKLGYKLVSKKNFSVDVFGGLSKTIFGPNTQDYKYPYTPVRFGIKIGKRF